MKLYIYLLILSVFILLACKKEEPFPTVYVPDTLKQFLPYQDGQKIKYGTTSGIVMEADITVASKFVEKKNCTSCDPYTRDEVINYDFKWGIKQFISMSVGNHPTIFMSIFSPEENLQIGAGFNFSTVAGVAEFDCNATRQKCLDSITLNGKQYLNVLEIINGATQPEKLTKAYYHKTKGLIGFKYGNGLVYSLLD